MAYCSYKLQLIAKRKEIPLPAFGRMMSPRREYEASLLKHIKLVIITIKEEQKWEEELSLLRISWYPAHLLFKGQKYKPTCLCNQGINFRSKVEEISNSCQRNERLDEELEEV